MQNNPSSNYLFDCPGKYQIRAWGAMDERWISQLQNMQISVTHTKNQMPVTKITGWLVDQTELSGLLKLLNDLGLVILVVRRLETHQQKPYYSD